MSKRIKTNYPGVYYRDTQRVGKTGTEKVYYITFKRNGKTIEEKVGRQYIDNMTPAKAARIRSDRIEGRRLSRKEKREFRKWTIDNIWEEYKRLHPNLKGFTQDENRYNNHIRQQFGSKEPNMLSISDIEKFKINLAKDKTPGTIKNIVELLRRIINFGTEMKLCRSIDFKIRLPKVNNIKTEDLTPEQLNKLIQAIEEDDDIQAAHFMKMALFTGMRRGELFRLKWDHINFDRGFIRIVDPKGGQNQDIPLNDATRELLQNHPKSESDYVFPGKDGKQRVDIKKSVNRIRKRAELPDGFRPLHGLRHVYASMLASSGEVDIYTLQKLLTHKSPQMAQRYAHLRDDALKRAANVIDDIMGNTTKKPPIDESP